jgi:hypothetical protein
LIYYVPSKEIDYCGTLFDTLKARAYWLFIFLPEVATKEALGGRVGPENLNEFLARIPEILGDSAKRNRVCLLVNTDDDNVYLMFPHVQAGERIADALIAAKLGERDVPTV